MTTSKATKYRDVVFGSIQGRATFGSVTSAALRADIESESVHHWPNQRYQKDIAGFFRDILGINPWHKQEEVFAALEAGETFIQVPSGHKTGKSLSAAGLSLWNACSFDDSRTILTSSTDRQVNVILWREFRKLHKRSGRCYNCKVAEPGNLAPCEHSQIIPGKPADVARSGFKLPGTFNEVFGFTSKEAEGFAGISGPRLLFIVDEASGVEDKIFETIEGNMAGGNAVVLSYSNPTRRAGWFYNACKRNPIGTTIQISSEDSPNVTAGEIVIPGLASLPWIEKMAKRWGRDSEWWQVRVKGEFGELSDLVPFSLDLIATAKMRWTPKPPDPTAPLTLSIDVAGDGLSSDDFVVFKRRGLWTSEALEGFKGDAQKQADYIMEMAEAERVNGETITIAFDAEGSAGWDFYLAIRDRTWKLDWIILKPVRSSKGAVRQPHLYHRVSAELVAAGKKYLEAGGAIAENPRLEEELHAWRFGMTTGDLKKGSRVTVNKEDVKELIGRSPDRSDAFFIAAWTWEAAAAGEDDLPVVETKAAEVHERSAERGDIPALRPDWDRAPGRDDSADEGAFRPLGPWG